MDCQFYSYYVAPKIVPVSLALVAWSVSCGAILVDSWCIFRLPLRLCKVLALWDNEINCCDFQFDKIKPEVLLCIFI